MASDSESASAVLDLTEPAGERAAPAAAATDEEDAPLIMDHGADIVVKVDVPMKQLSTLETYVTYRVRCACARWQAPSCVRRRYNHFKVLHRRLSLAHPWVAVPPLPPAHSPRQQLDRYSPAFVAVRTLALHAFLERVARHPILTHSDDLRVFLTTPDEQLEKVFKNESGALSLWGLSSALYNGQDSRPAGGARVKDPEFSSAAEYLQCLQQKLTTLCSLTTRLHQGSVALATELTGMKRACDAWSCQCAPPLSLAVAGAALGAGGAGAARGAAPLPARATLPLLAAHAAVLADKIRQRDALHAAHVAESSDGAAAGETHNRLTVASETLRSELALWGPRTRHDVRALLLELASRRVHALTQVLSSWEHALRLASGARAEDVFKTVSRAALRSLSPARAADTEADFDDLDYSDCELPAGGVRASETERRDSVEALSDPLRSFSDVDLSS